ncbi:putative quinol monooxygenase [Erwinia sp. V71]|uniref:putative quinol monooxygenase n=1 Tax=Erwinia sp. V71 TaxID=3369424 RepID=UPI003F6022B5
MPAVELIVTLQASEGRAEEVRNVLLTLRDASLQEPGCFGYRIAQGEPSTHRFFLLERWSDPTALFQHEHTSHFLEGVARLQTCCESISVQPVAWLPE